MPAQKPSQPMSSLDRLKLIQQQFKQGWQGISTEHTGRPGTSNLCNQTRKFREFPQAELEEGRNTLFMKVFDTLRNIEQEHPLLIPNANDAKSRTTSNFYQKQKLDRDGNINHYHHSTQYQGVN